MGDLLIVIIDVVYRVYKYSKMVNLNNLGNHIMVDFNFIHMNKKNSFAKTVKAYIIVLKIKFSVELLGIFSMYECFGNLLVR